MITERQMHEGGQRAADRRARRTMPAGSLWTRQVGVWLAALRYRPERTYMRGDRKTAQTVARG